MISLATKQIEIRATSVRVSDDALIVDLTTGERCQRRWHGIRGYCMVRLRSETIINLLARVSEFIGRNWMKTSVLRGFLPEGGHMRVGSRLSSGSPRGHAPLNRDSIRIGRVCVAIDRRETMLNIIKRETSSVQFKKFNHEQDI